MTTVIETETENKDSQIQINSLGDIEFRRKVSSPAFRLFISFCNHWGFNESQRLILLGDLHRQTYLRWKREGVKTLKRDQLERISLLLGIHKGLGLLFVDYDNAKRWLFSLNHDLPFSGISPSEYLLNGSIKNFYEVRRYLDAWREMK